VAPGYTHRQMHIVLTRWTGHSLQVRYWAKPIETYRSCSLYKSYCNVSGVSESRSRVL